MKNLAPESVILCEGYHDRAFLSALLEFHGCRSLKGKPYRGSKALTGRGQYAFETPKGGWVRIVPVDGEENLTKAANIELAARETSALAHLVLVRDDDSVMAMLVSDESNQRTALETWARREWKACPIEGTHDFKIVGGLFPTQLSFLIWCTDDARAELSPLKQTLERLVCAAIAETYPDRCKSVADFIVGRPNPPIGEKLHKAHAAAHMAGWYSSRGYEGFFHAVWEDDGVREVLLRRLHATGAMTIFEAILGGDARGPAMTPQNSRISM